MTGFDALSVQAKTDWLRLCLVEKYGGVWLDASIICNRSIEESIDINETRVVGFECPIGQGILESWAFGARPSHPFITEWKHEFARAIRIGFKSYKETCGLHTHAIFEEMPYLTIHGAFVIVSRRFPGHVSMHHSLDPHHGPYYFTKDEWKRGNRSHCALKLMLKDYNYPPLLKFTGETRGYVNIYMKLVPIFPRSFFARTLHLNNPSIQLLHVTVIICLILVVR